MIEKHLTPENKINKIIFFITEGQVHILPVLFFNSVTTKQNSVK